MRWRVAQIKGACKSEGKIYNYYHVIMNSYLFDILQKVLLDGHVEGMTKLWNLGLDSGEITRLQDSLQAIYVAFARIRILKLFYWLN